MSTDEQQASAEAQQHAQAVFARMSARHRVPAARRAQGQRLNPRPMAPDVKPKTWESGADKALPNGDRD